MHLVLPAEAILILKRLRPRSRPRKVAVLVQVIQMTSTLSYCQFITATYKTCQESIFSVKDGVV